MANQKFKVKVQADAGVQITNIAASQALQLDGAGNIASSATTATELGYVSGVTSSIQTQLNGKIQADGSIPFTADQSLGSHKITNLADPTSPQDAVTKNYADNLAAGIKPKQAVRASTLVAGTLATSFANGSVIDGVTLVTGNRILIKNQATASENGIYVVAASGAPTRAVDFDAPSEINGAYTAVQEGSQAGQAWIQTGTVTTVGTDAINFVYFNSAGTITAGSGINITSSVVSVDPTNATAETVAGNTDLLLIYSAADAGLRKMTRANFLAGFPHSSPGDLNEASFSMANNVSSAANVTGFAFSNTVVRSFKALVSVEINATSSLYETFELQGIQKGSSWDLAVSSVGDNSVVTFSITTAGQVQYTSGNSAGFTTGLIKFRAVTTSF